LLWCGIARDCGPFVVTSWQLIFFSKGSQWNFPDARAATNCSKRAN
jgi:hypothetical protein